MKYILKTIKSINVIKYDTIVSCSLFKMIKGYKDFSTIYFDMLKNWIDKIPKNAYTRLYVDASVLDYPKFEELMSNSIKNLEIILFQFDDFLKEDGIHHDGTFGSMTRFLPLYSDFRPKNIKYVWITDVDVHPRVLSEYNLINMTKVRAEISYLSVMCYNKPWISKENKYPIVTYRLIVDVSKVKLKFQDFENFLEDVIKGKYKDIYNQIRQFSIDNNEITKIPTYEFIQYFPYGFDELFVNKFYPSEFLKYKRRIAFIINLFNYKNVLKYNKEKYKNYGKLHKLSWDAEFKLNVKGKKELLELILEIYEKNKSDLEKNFCMKDLPSLLTRIDFNEIALSSVVILNPNKI